MALTLHTGLGDIKVELFCDLVRSSVVAAFFPLPLPTHIGLTPCPPTLCRPPALVKIS